MSDDVKIYRYNDDISFRQCTLANSVNNLTYGDCTCFEAKEEKWKTHYFCRQYGIHLHCTKHTEQELIFTRDDRYTCYLKCPKCDKKIEIMDLDKILQDCIKMLNIPKFKNAKLIRLDDWYIPELKKEIKDEKISDYWIKSDIKTDKDGDTIVVLYIGKRDSKDKCQFFIKPEKLQLSNDYKDLDLAKILTKIEVTLKNRNIKREYNNK